MLVTLGVNGHFLEKKKPYFNGVRDRRGSIFKNSVNEPE